MKYTIFIREADGTGTTYITAIVADTIEEAKQAALEECAYEWSANMGDEDGYTPEDLHVLGVAQGDIDILEWDDQV